MALFCCDEGILWGMALQKQELTRERSVKRSEAGDSRVSLALL